MSEMAEYGLTHYVVSSPSSVRDTTDFIVNLKGDVTGIFPVNTICSALMSVKFTHRYHGIKELRHAERRCPPVLRCEGTRSRNQ